MSPLVLPDVASIAIVTGARANPEPALLSGLVFAARLHSTQRNDYELEPFVSNAAGIVEFARERLLHLVSAAHDSGLMDYAGLAACSGAVELRLLSGAEVARAAQARRTVWHELLNGERSLFASIEELVAVYDEASNSRVVAQTAVVRSTWIGDERTPHYTLYVDQVLTA